MDPDNEGIWFSPKGQRNAEALLRAILRCKQKGSKHPEPQTENKACDGYTTWLFRDQMPRKKKPFQLFRAPLDDNET